MTDWNVSSILWIAVTLQYMSVFSVVSCFAITTPGFDSIKGGEDYTENPNSLCTGLFTVGTEAKKISVPETDGGKPLSCKWILKTSHYHHKVALSLIDMGLLIGIGDYFKLQVRDGESTDSPLLATLEYEHETFLNFSWNVVEPIVSSGEYLTLEYTSRGNNPFMADFLYYTCGGVVNAHTYVSSPIFTEYPVPKVVDCKWHFLKPADALYGSVKLLHVNITEESVLQISTNSSMKVLEYVDNNQTRSSSAANSEHPDSKASNGIDVILEWANETNNTLDRRNDTEVDAIIQSPATIPNITVQPIYGNSINNIVFDGEVAVLSYYIGEPRLDVGFNALYFPVVVPARRKRVPVPWHVHYSGITIYTPIGVLIGGLIIFFQLRRRNASKASFEAVTRSFNSEPTLTQGLKFSFRSERNLRVGSLRGVPENLSRSLTNLRSYFTTSSDSRTKGSKRELVPQRTEALQSSRQDSPDNQGAKWRDQSRTVTIVFSKGNKDIRNSDKQLKVQKLSRSAEDITCQVGEENTLTLPNARRTKSATFVIFNDRTNTDSVLT